MRLDRRILAVVLMASLGTLLTACQREGTSSMDRASSAQQPSQSAPQTGSTPPSSSSAQSGNSNTNTAAAPAPPSSDNSASTPSEDKNKSKDEMSKQKSSS